MTYIAMFQKAPGVIESIMLVKYLGHNYYILSLADPCPGVEKKILKKINNAFSLYDLFGHTIAKEPLTQGL